MGAEDGIFGLGTRGAVQRWQVASKAEGTGYLTADQAQALIEAGREVEVAVGVYPSAPRPGETFRDCPECPEMVVVPAGRFTMGSPPSEEGRRSSESPQHQVTIPAPLAVGRYEVTFAEWDACVAAGGCGGYRPGDEGWGRGRRPVMNVSWDDAQSYVHWLSRRTGQRYRLLSESEWEYAVRAGTTTARYWGESPSDACGYANLHDTTSKRVNGYDWPPHACNDGVAKVAPVGSYRANAFGLHDMLGNVWEWVEDRPYRDYTGAPSDGSASTSGGDCSWRVLRGGSWSSGLAFARSAFRYGNVTGRRGSGIGFRVARSL